MSKKIFLLAGEESGDLLGAALMKDLKILSPDVVFSGVGGKQMAEQGLVSIFPMTDLSVMGLAEVVKHLPRLVKRINQTVATVLEQKPDVVVTVDAPDFSFRVARKIKQKNPSIKIIHMVAPTVWAWRPGRAKKIAQLLDGILCLYPFEPSDHGMPGVIPQLAKPVALRAFFTNQLKLPPAAVLTGLTSMRQIPGFTNRFLILHQKGMMWMIEKTGSGQEERTLFGDLTGEVFSERGPNGLLDVAFHPKFQQNRKYYIFYQVFENGKATSLIVEKEFAADFKSDSGKSPRQIMKIVSIAEDHSGGCLLFGADGYLYLVMGDTGPQQDPNGHAQDLRLLLGKVMRIDVDHAEGGESYSIPSDNPFRGQAGTRPEIWAYGFRNPWRFSFDRLTGDLWVADVGQDRVEEVDIVHRGENYGWNVYEGFEPFSNQYRKEGRIYTKPVFAYRRKYGASVTGGHVFRGDPKSSFYGVYVCGDYVSKRIFGVIQKNGALEMARQICVSPQPVVSFSEDAAGNLYVIGFEGVIYRMDFSQARFE